MVTRTLVKKIEGKEYTYKINTKLPPLKNLNHFHQENTYYKLSNKLSNSIYLNYNIGKIKNIEVKFPDLHIFNDIIKPWIEKYNIKYILSECEYNYKLDIYNIKLKKSINIDFKSKNTLKNIKNIILKVIKGKTCNVLNYFIIFEYNIDNEFYKMSSIINCAKGKELQLYFSKNNISFKFE